MSNVPQGKELIDDHYARGDEQYRGMLEKVARDGNKCPLCTLAVHPKPVLKHLGWFQRKWFITERHEVPEGVKHYFLIIAKRHIENYEKMSIWDDWAIRRLIRWAKKEYELEGFGITLRSGASRRTGATIRHLHFHLIFPEIDPTTNRAIPYYFPIG